MSLTNRVLSVAVHLGTGKVDCVEEVDPREGGMQPDIPERIEAEWQAGEAGAQSVDEHARPAEVAFHLGFDIDEIEVRLVAAAGFGDDSGLLQRRAVQVGVAPGADADALVAQGLDEGFQASEDLEAITDLDGGRLHAGELEARRDRIRVTPLDAARLPDVNTLAEIEIRHATSHPG